MKLTAEGIAMTIVACGVVLTLAILADIRRMNRVRREILQRREEGAQVRQLAASTRTGEGVGYLDSVLVAIVCDVRGGMSTTAILDKYRAALAASTRTGEQSDA